MFFLKNLARKGLSQNKFVIHFEYENMVSTTNIDCQGSTNYTVDPYEK